MPLNKTILFILKALHYGFLLAILSEHRSENVYIYCILSAVALLLYSYSKAPQTHLKLEWKELWVIVHVLLGAMLTYYLNQQTNLGIVLSSAIIGSIGACIPNKSIFKQADVGIYCGVFVGMTAPFLAQGYVFIAIAAGLAGLLFVFSKNVLQGFGGKLGTIAFGGVAIWSLLIYVSSLI